MPCVERRDDDPLGARMNTRSSPPPNLLQTAVSFLQQGRLADAETVCRQILQVRPNDFDALHLLGMLTARMGRPEPALELLQRAVEQRTNVPTAYNNLGNVLRMLKRPHEALQQYSRAIELRPQFVEALLGRSSVLLELLEPAKALADANAVLALGPPSHIALLTRGLAQLGTNDPGAAIVSLDAALKMRPDDDRAHSGLAAALLALNRPAEALPSSDRAIALNPSDAAAHVNRAAALQALGRPEEALASGDTAIKLDPQMAAAYNARAAALADSFRAEEALRSADTAIALQPGYAQAFVNRAAALLDLQRPEEALSSADQAIAQQPTLTLAHINRGIALQALARTREALASLRTATSLDPTSVEAHFNEALCHLQLGQFDPGWPLYEWRLKIRAGPANTAAPPRWTGQEALGGKSIVLHAEQGLGDTLQFCRFATRVRQLGARVILSVQPDLCGLLAGLDSDITVTSDEPHQIRADFQLPLASVPYALGLGSQPLTAQDLARQTPYLHADPQRIVGWRQRLSHPAGYKVGINWQGSRNKIDLGRSIPLRHFATLTELPGVRLVSLQKGYGAEQLNELPPHIRDRIEAPVRGMGSEALQDLAALIKSLDLVITSDTLIAHLAGALGVPTWVAVKFSPDWRWMLGRDDSPWYPTVRLFRQTRLGDWDSVFERISVALRPARDPG